MSGPSPTCVTTDIEADGPGPSANSMLIFDRPWMDEYPKAFLGIRLPSFMGGLFGRPCGDWLKSDFPPDRLGHVEHTHRAIDDARGNANILSRLLWIAGTQSRKPEDFRRIA